MGSGKSGESYREDIPLKWKVSGCRHGSLTFKSELNPVTRSVPSGKTYNRKKEKQRIGKEFRNGFDADLFCSEIYSEGYQTQIDILPKNVYTVGNDRCKGGMFI